MKHIKVAFTDSFGLTHDEAVFELGYGYKNVNRSETIGSSTSTESVVTVTYQFKYWHNEKARLAGKQALVLTDADGAQMFTEFVAGVDDIDDIEGFAIQKLVEKTLPAIDPEAKVID